MQVLITVRYPSGPSHPEANAVMSAVEVAQKIQEQYPNARVNVRVLW